MPVDFSLEPHAGLQPLGGSCPAFAETAQEDSLLLKMQRGN